jgi:hypothetical protein
MNRLDKHQGRPRLTDGVEAAPRSDVREERPEQRDAVTGREERIPLGIARLKLKVPEIPGYRLRWVNDESSRIYDAQQGGYEFVNADEIDGKFGDTDIDQTNRDLGSKVCRSVSKTTSLKAFLMKIRTEYYEADQLAKQKQIDEVDQAIHNGKLKNFVNQYVPENGKGIQIRTSDERI